MNIKIKLLNEKAKLPTSGSKYSAGYDLYSTETKVVRGLSTEMLQSGIAMEIPEGFFGAIFARSGLASRKGIRPATCVSVIDADYRGEIGIPLHNDNVDEYRVLEGERIAQMIILPCQEVEFEIVEELDSTERGEGGYGSTGKR